MEKVFTALGKLFLVLLILGLLGLAGIYLNKKGYFNTKILNTSSPTPSATTSVSGNYNLQVLETPQPVPQSKVVSAGLDATSGLSFTKYQLQLPADWIDSHTYEKTGVPVDTLTLTKGLYQIKIFQAATGGALCLYPGSAPFEGPSSSYDNFVELNTTDGVILRRSGSTAYSGTTRGFTGCQKSADGSYQQPTIFGHVSITTPVSYDLLIITEIDGILTSLKKIL